MPVRNSQPDLAPRFRHCRTILEIPATPNRLTMRDSVSGPRALPLQRQSPGRHLVAPLSVLQSLCRPHAFVRWAMAVVAAFVAMTPLGSLSADAPGSQASGPKADLRAGLALLVSDDPNIEREDAVNSLRRAAERGDLSARFNLAYLYWSSLDPDVQDDRMALQLFLDVAKTGDPYAAANVGTFLHQGIGVRQNPAAARAWYEVAAKGGLSNPAWRLAMMFERGNGVRRDLLETYTWLDIADDLSPRATEPREASGAAQRRDDLATRLSAAQISRARDRARTWLAARNPSANCDAESTRFGSRLPLTTRKARRFRHGLTVSSGSCARGSRFRRAPESRAGR